MKYLKFCLLIIGSVLFFSYASAQKRVVKKADEAFDIGEYHLAFELYEKAYEKLSEKDLKAEIAFKMGECNRIMMDDKGAVRWYKKAVRAKINNPMAYLYYADGLKISGDYEDAKEEYKKYKNMVPDDPRGNNGIESCELAPEWMNNPTRYIVTEAEDINSASADFCPSFGQSRSELYFSSNRESANGKNLSNITGENYSDIFIAKKDRKGKWSVPVPVEGNVNSEGSEGAACVINDGAIMYFSMCEQVENANMGCKIYRSKNNAGGWSDPVMEKIKGDSSVSYGHPAVTEDELTMYFVSDSIPGKKSFGGKDIWVVTRSSAGGPWSEPENLGSKINTKGDEKFPYIRQNGELYFSSDGHVGMGGLDIFKAVKNGTVWEVENMKFPVNSSNDDFGICFYEDKNLGYFTSNRNKKINIYEFEMPDMIFTLKGTVMDADANAVIAGADIKLTSPSGHELEIKSSAEGTFRFNLNKNTDYSVIASKTEYLSAIVDRSTKGLDKSTEFDVILELERYGGKQIELPNIEYDFGQTTLREESKVSLDELVKTLTLNSHITIELSANTDFRGSDESNQKLSEGRANSVMDYLISKGIKEDRLNSVGNGERVPKKIDSKTKNGRQILSAYKFLKNGDVLTEEFINNLESEEEKEICHQLNRRTEFRVLRDDYGINAIKFGGDN